MTTTVLLVCVLLAVFLFLLLWFKKAWTVLHERKKTVELAAQQVNILRAVSPGVDGLPLERSEKIYAQAVVLYMEEYNKPVNHIPAMLLGFHPIVEEGNVPSGRPGYHG